MLADSFRSAQEINAALDGAPALPVAFPNSGLGQQLAQVAQIMSVRGALGMNRQIFFAGMGGFDNHEDLVNKHQDLMATFDAAVNAFFNTLDAWGLTNQVTLFTESEFNRTGNANANLGTDHAWGGHHIVLGGAVHGGQTYGTFPRTSAARPRRCRRPRQLDSARRRSISTPPRSGAGSACRTPISIGSSRTCGTSPRGSWTSSRGHELGPFACRRARPRRRESHRSCG